MVSKQPTIREFLATQARLDPIQGGVAHIYTVGISATAVKLKVNGQFEIFSKVYGQATTFL